MLRRFERGASHARWRGASRAGGDRAPLVRRRRAMERRLAVVRRRRRLAKASGEERIDERGGGDERGVGALVQEVERARRRS